MKLVFGLCLFVSLLVVTFSGCTNSPDKPICGNGVCEGPLENGENCSINDGGDCLPGEPALCPGYPHSSQTENSPINAAGVSENTKFEDDNKKLNVPPIKIAKFDGEVIEKSLGKQKILIFLTKDSGDIVPDLPNLNSNMQKMKDELLEQSYGLLKIEWQVFGWYDSSQVDIFKLTDPYINWDENISTIIIVNKSFGAAASQYTLYTDEGEKTVGLIKLSPEMFQKSTLNELGALIHEFGHTLGLAHSNLLWCGAKAFANPYDFSECRSIGYGDNFDSMGTASSCHYNSYQKEKLHWLQGKKIQTVTNSGIYTLYSYETDANNPIVLKVPWKKNEDGKPENFYYIEYRTKRGLDINITENGPQVRMPMFLDGVPYVGTQISGGLTRTGDIHLIDMAPDKYLSGGQNINNGISIGKEFTDPYTKVKIATLTVDENKATLNISLSDIPCVRKTPTLDIYPEKIEGTATESFVFDIRVVNNDSPTCSDRTAGIRFENNYPDLFDAGIGHVGEMSGFGGFYPFYTGQISLSQLYVKPLTQDIPIDKHYQFSVTIVDGKDVPLSSKKVEVKVKHEYSKPFWAGKDVALKFSYTPTGNGYYILDKNGEIYEYGDTDITTKNSPTFTKNSITAISFAKSPNLPARAANYIVLDSKGNVYDAGSSRKEYYFYSPETMLPKFSCNLARDVKTGFDKTDGLFLLDAYGSVYSTGYLGLGGENSALSQNYPCITWDGKTDAYRSNQDHAREIEVVSRQGSFPRGYYLLSSDATIYACGEVPVEYTKLNQKFDSSKDNQAIAMALDINNGILVLDNHGRIYTTGSAKHLGQENFIKTIARDIQLLPANKGYGILAADGAVSEFQNN